MNRNTFNAMAAQYAVKTVSGKNLFNSRVASVQSVSDIPYISEVGEGFVIITTPEGNMGSGFTYSSKKLREFAPTLQVGKTYTLSFNTESRNRFIYLSGHNDYWEARTSLIMTEAMLESVVDFYGFNTVVGQPSGDCRISNIQIEEGTVATPYEPYSGGDGVRCWNNGVRCVLPEVQIGGKVEQEQYEGYNRLQLDGKTENNEVTVSYDPDTQIFTLNGTKTLPGNLILSDSAHINWDGAEKFWTVRQKIGGNVTLDANGAGRYLLWSVFTNDYNSYTCRTKCTTQDESEEFVANVVSGVGKIEQSPAGSGYRILLQCLGCSAENPIVFDNYQVRLMITEADTNDWSIPTAYEPYTGGMPVPNPDWPVMPVISEGTEVMCRSENVLDLAGILGEGYTNTLHGITVTVENGVAKFRGEHTNSDWSSPLSVTGLTRHQYMLYPGTYTIPVVNGAALVLQFAEKDSWVAGTHGGNKSLTFTTPEPLWMIGFYVAFYGIQTVNVDIPLTIVRGTEQPTEYIPYHDDGTAVAPVPLLAAVDGTCQSTWNPQTGKGLNWWWDKIVFDGRVNWGPYPPGKGFYAAIRLPETMTRNAYWSNMTRSGVKDEMPVGDEPFLCCGAQNDLLYFLNNPFFDASASYGGVDNLRQYLTSHPLEVWVARNEPVEFQTDPQPLIAPHGSGQIVQTGGTVDGVPIAVKYVTHS